MMLARFIVLLLLILPWMQQVEGIIVDTIKSIQIKTNQQDSALTSTALVDASNIESHLTSIAGASSSSSSLISFASFSASPFPFPNANAFLIDQSQKKPLDKYTYLLSKPLGHACSRSSVKTSDIPKASQPWIALIDRGSCSYANKALVAQDLGASGVVITANYDSLVDSTTGFLNDICSVDCTTFASVNSIDECQQGCPSKLCIAPKNSMGIKPKYCCVVDSLLKINLGKDISKIHIPVVTTTIQEGVKLKSLVATSTYNSPNGESQAKVISVSRTISNGDGSIFLLALSAVVIVIASTYRSTRFERKAAAWTFMDGGGIDPETLYSKENDLFAVNDFDPRLAYELTPRKVFMLFLGGFGGMIGVYIISQKWPHTVMVLLNVIFGLVATGSLSFIVLQPAVFALNRKFFKVEVVSLFSSRGEVAATSIAFIITSVWFAFRQETVLWFLQDIFVVSTACMFLLYFRIQNLRTGMLMAILYFFFDLIMVVLSPLLFQGRNIMYEVLSSGKAVEVVTDMGNCIRNAEESAPTFFMVPRFDWTSGFMKIGFDDIIIPAMLISLSQRIDYARCERDARARAEMAHLPGAKKQSIIGAYYYWIPLCVAYSVGLALAATFYGQSVFPNPQYGQTTLLFTIPCILFTFLYLSQRKKEFASIWGDTWKGWNQADQGVSEENRTDGEEYAPRAHIRRVDSLIKNVGGNENE